jgi:hypothetical protein
VVACRRRCASPAVFPLYLQRVRPLATSKRSSVPGLTLLARIGVAWLEGARLRSFAAFSDRSQIKSLASMIARVGYAWTDRPGGVTTHTLAVQIRDPAVEPLWRARRARLGGAEDGSRAPLPALHPVYSRLDA